MHSQPLLFFMRVKDEPKGFQNLQKRLIKSYRAYKDKGKYVSKKRDMTSKYNEVMRDLRKTARTEEQSIATAKMLYELADFAVRTAVEEACDKPAEDQTEGEEEDIELSPQAGFG